MAYNLELEELLFIHLAKVPQIEKKSMFGGIGYLINGNMALGIHKDELMVRFDPLNYNEIMAMPHTKTFDMGHSRSSKGWVLVKEPGWKNDAQLKTWIRMGYDFACSLPPKEKAKGGKTKAKGKSSPIPPKKKKAAAKEVVVKKSAAKKSATKKVASKIVRPRSPTRRQSKRRKKNKSS